MDDHPLFARVPSESLLFRRQGEYIDFFRSYGRKSHSKVEAIFIDIENDRVAKEIIERASRLIREYCATGRRVGVVLSRELILQVVQALVSDSRRDSQFLEGFTDMRPTERFLAESLVREIYELQSGNCSLDKEQYNALSARVGWLALIASRIRLKTKICLQYDH